MKQKTQKPKKFQAGGIASLPALRGVRARPSRMQSGTNQYNFDPNEDPTIEAIQRIVSGQPPKNSFQRDIASGLGVRYKSGGIIKNKTAKVKKK